MEDAQLWLVAGRTREGRDEGVNKHCNECSDASHSIRILLEKLQVSSCVASGGGPQSGVLVFCPDKI